MLDALVNEYLRLATCSDCFDDRMMLNECRDIRDIITNSALSTYQGKRHPHQRRIPQSVLEASKNALLHRADSLEQATTFEELFQAVECALKPINGAGELLIYDIAQRIGTAKGIEPERVYLHAGTRIGAERLGLHEKSLEMSQLPEALQRLTPAQAEDFLCVFKDRLPRRFIQKS